MPKVKQLKYRCGELACRKVIRGDKWTSHCKKDHGWKLARGQAISKTIVAVKDEGTDEWRPYSESQSSSTSKSTVRLRRLRCLHFLDSIL